MASVELPLKRLVIFSLRSDSTLKSCLFSVDKDSVMKRYFLKQNNYCATASSIYKATKKGQRVKVPSNVHFSCTLYFVI